MVKPIQPSEIGAQAAKTLPDEVIEAFNELIAENYVSGQAKVLQKNVMARIRQKRGSDSFDSNWLNVEEVFRDAGWKVSYDKPVAYGGEDFEAFFTFVKK